MLSIRSCLNYDSQVGLIGGGSTFCLGVSYKGNWRAKSGLWLSEVKKLVLPTTQTDRWLTVHQELEAGVLSNGTTDLDYKLTWFRAKFLMTQWKAVT